MSTVYNPANIISNLKAGADLSAEANRYKAVKFDGSGDIVLAGAGDDVLGFLQNLPDSGEAVEIATLGGGSLAISAATIAAGDFLKADANGDLVIASTADDLAIARAMESSVDNDVFSVQVIILRIHA